MLLYKVLRQLRFVAHATLQSTKTIKVCSSMLLYKVLRQLRFVAHATLQSTKTIKVCSSCSFTKY